MKESVDFHSGVEKVENGRAHDDLGDGRKSGDVAVRRRQGHFEQNEGDVAVLQGRFHGNGDDFSPVEFGHPGNYGSEKESGQDDQQSGHQMAPLQQNENVRKYVETQLAGF